MAIKVRIERVEVKYSGKFTDYDGAEIINMAIKRYYETGYADITMLDVTEYNGNISPTCRDGDVLKVRVYDKDTSNHIAEVEWYYVEEDADEDDGYYDDSRRFYEDDCSYETYEGWRQQDIIDSYRRER